MGLEHFCSCLIRAKRVLQHLFSAFGDTFSAMGPRDARSLPFERPRHPYPLPCSLRAAAFLAAYGGGYGGWRARRPEGRCEPAAGQHWACAWGPWPWRDSPIPGCRPGLHSLSFAPMIWSWFSPGRSADRPDWLISTGKWSWRACSTLLGLWSLEPGRSRGPVGRILHRTGSLGPWPGADAAGPGSIPYLPPAPAIYEVGACFRPSSSIACLQRLFFILFFRAAASALACLLGPVSNSPAAPFPAARPPTSGPYGPTVPQPAFCVFPHGGPGYISPCCFRCAGFRIASGATSWFTTWAWVKRGGWLKSLR